jgi:hypothetical protein
VVSSSAFFTTGSNVRGVDGGRQKEDRQRCPTGPAATTSSTRTEVSDGAHKYNLHPCCCLVPASGTRGLAHVCACTAHPIANAAAYTIYTCAIQVCELHACSLVGTSRWARLPRYLFAAHQLLDVAQGVAQRRPASRKSITSSPRCRACRLAVILIADPLWLAASSSRSTTLQCEGALSSVNRVACSKNGRKVGGMPLVASRVQMQHTAYQQLAHA